MFPLLSGTPTLLPVFIVFSQLAFLLTMAQYTLSPLHFYRGGSNVSVVGLDMKIKKRSVCAFGAPGDPVIRLYL